MFSLPRSPPVPRFLLILRRLMARRPAPLKMIFLITRLLVIQTRLPAAAGGRRRRWRRLPVLVVVVLLPIRRSPVAAGTRLHLLLTVVPIGQTGLQLYLLLLIPTAALPIVGTRKADAREHAGLVLADVAGSGWGQRRGGLGAPRPIIITTFLSGSLVLPLR